VEREEGGIVKGVRLRVRVVAELDGVIYTEVDAVDVRIPLSKSRADGGVAECRSSAAVARLLPVEREVVHAVIRETRIVTGLAVRAGCGLDDARHAVASLETGTILGVGAKVGVGVRLVRISGRGATAASTAVMPAEVAVHDRQHQAIHARVV